VTDGSPQTDRGPESHVGAAHASSADPPRRTEDGGRTVSFEDLVTAATVGVSRKPLAITGLDGPAAGQAGALDAGDQAAALLDAAALMTVAGRAGYRPEQGQRIVGPSPSPSPSPEDAAPELSARAERALRQLGGARLAPGFAAGDKELLADLLAAAADAGYVASAPLLPDLLDAAVRTVALRPTVTAVLGARGRWLAAYRADWQRVVEAAPTKTTATVAAAAEATPAASADPQTWRTGSRAERHAYLAAQRERDPDAGRELLAADWARLAADERAALLAVLARGLSAGDEEFLDGVLDDRAAGVSVIAQRLLTRLPGSRFRQRATDRATSVLRLERHRQRQSLAVTRPADPDAAAGRDGIDSRPPSPSIGVGAWLLTQLIAAVPLAAWTDLFGFSPDEIVALAVEPRSDAPRRLDVHAGWRLAAVSQGSAEWAEALLAADDPDDGGGRPPAAWPDDQRLAAVLPAARRAERAAAVLAGTKLTPGPAAANRAIAEVGGVPMPWPGGLADAVVAVLSRAAPLAVLPRLPRGLLDLAARGLPATGSRDHAAELTRLADARPQTWTPLVRKTAETILLRRAFLEEIR
jgi:Family of unknown function (DUF5691)